MSGKTPALGDDWVAIAAHAAHHDITGPAEALASWRALSEDRRIAWRASADAVRMLFDADVGKLALARDSQEARADLLAAERDGLLGLAAEILAAVSGWTVLEEDLKQIAKWRERAGIEATA